jgi:hypothetical protein
MRMLIWSSLVFAGLASASLFSQEQNAAEHRLKLQETKRQTVLQTLPSALGSVGCDPKFNIFFTTNFDREGPGTIVKFDSKAEKLVPIDFSAPELRNLVINEDRFTITTNSHLYVRAALRTGKDRGPYIVEFDADGKFKSKTKLQGYFSVGHVGVYPNGGFLIVGHNDADKRLRKGYFTAIFSASGELQRYVDIKDDARTTEMIQAKNSNYVNTSTPVPLDRTIELGHLRSLDDGNVYFLRRTSPAKIYGINSGGEVVRTIAVDAGANMFPSDFEYSNGYFAVRMHDPNKPASGVFKIVAAETGEEFAEIEAQRVSAAFSCYEAPATIKVLTADDGKLVVKTLQAN